jgi:transposase
LTRLVRLNQIPPVGVHPITPGTADAIKNERFENLRSEYPETEALTERKGIGYYSALMLIGEFGDGTRFRSAKHAAAFTGLRTRVFQSVDHCRRGHVFRQRWSWHRWMLLEAAMKFVRKGVPLATSMSESVNDPARRLLGVHPHGSWRRFVGNA